MVIEGKLTLNIFGKVKSYIKVQICFERNFNLEKNQHAIRMKLVQTEPHVLSAAANVLTASKINCLFLSYP